MKQKYSIFWQNISMNDKLLDFIILFLIIICLSTLQSLTLKIEVWHTYSLQIKSTTKERKSDYIDIYKRNILYDVGYFKWIKTQWFVALR